MTTHAAVSLDLARSLWLDAQRLSAPADSALDAVRRSGWWHSAGGATVPLAMTARGVAITDAVRAELDHEELLEVPGVRRSTFLVPREDAGVALAASVRSTRTLIAGAWRAAGGTPRDPTTIKNAILEELAAAPLSMSTLASRVPPRTVRKTGSDGGALGLPSTVHLALRELQHEGRVVRIPRERRLDSDRYRWKRTSIATVALDDAALDQELASRVVRWAGPATLKEIAWWAGITQRAARTALEALGCETVEVEGWTAHAYVEPGRLDHAPAPAGGIVLVPFRDNYVALRRGLVPLLSPGAMDAHLLDWRGKPATAGALDALHHPAILVGGLIAGIWEFDPDRGEVVWRLFGDNGPSGRRLLRAVRAVENLIRDELGDARFYAFDSGPGRRARIEDAAHER